MANPQPEDGYTILANEILEAMARTKLSPTQYRLLFVVWRYTYVKPALMQYRKPVGSCGEKTQNQRSRLWVQNT
jgi:hypothetical protein